MKVERASDELVSQLEDWKRQEAGGVLAKLRRGLSEATKQDAWAVLGGRFGKRAIGNPVWETVAGCFAFHSAIWLPLEDTRKDAERNMGWTYLAVRSKDKVEAEKMTKPDEPHTRFRRLLACDEQQEICEHVTHAIRLAKSKDVKVNYRQLFCDLWWWDDRVKVAWAKAYWNVSDDSLPPDGAGFEELGQPSPNVEPAPDSADDSED